MLSEDYAKQRLSTFTAGRKQAILPLEVLLNRLQVRSKVSYVQDKLGPLLHGKHELYSTKGVKDVLCRDEKVRDSRDIALGWGASKNYDNRAGSLIHHMTEEQDIMLRQYCVLFVHVCQCQYSPK